MFQFFPGCNPPPKKKKKYNKKNNKLIEFRLHLQFAHGPVVGTEVKDLSNKTEKKKNYFSWLITHITYSEKVSGNDFWDDGSELKTIQKVEHGVRSGMGGGFVALHTVPR